MTQFLLYIYIFKIGGGWEFPGGLVVKELALTLLQFRFNTWPGNFCNLKCSQKKKKKKKKWWVLIIVLTGNINGAFSKCSAVF